MSHNNQLDPFADEPAHATLDTDPFADSVRDPFSQPNESSVSFGGAGGSTTNTYGDYGYGGGHANQDANKKAEELRRREEELNRREAEFTRRQQESGAYANNWPPSTWRLKPLTKTSSTYFSTVYPFVHYDPSVIQDPSKRQTITLIGYQWYALVVALIINLLGCIFLLISGSSEGGWASIHCTILTKLIFIQSRYGELSKLSCLYHDCLLYLMVPTNLSRLLQKWRQGYGYLFL